MKIALFNYQMLEFGGGVAKYFIEVSRGLKKRYPDLEISLINFDESALKWILLGYSLYFFGKQDRSLNNKEEISTLQNKSKTINYLKVGSINKLRSELQKYDVVYTTNNLFEVLLLKYILSFKDLPPIIFGFHIPAYFPLTGTLQSKLHNFIYASKIYLNAIAGGKKLHLVNNFDEELFGKYFSKEKIVKINYPYDFSLNLKKISKFKSRGQNGVRKIAWIGRLTEQKGIDDLAKLVERINSTGLKNKVQWIIAGDGELKPKILNLVRSWNNIKYLGYVQNKEIGKILREVDLFISTSKWESFPYNILEAQSFGLPVVAYNIHGCRDIITDSKNGVLVNDFEQFQSKIVQLIRQNYFRKEKILKFVQNKFDQEKIYKKMYEL